MASWTRGSRSPADGRAFGGSRTSAWRAPETRRRPGTTRSAATTWSPGMEQIGMRPQAPSVRLASGCPEASCHVDLPDRASRDEVAVAALGPAREHDGRGHEHREHEPGVHRGSIRAASPQGPGSGPRLTEIGARSGGCRGTVLVIVVSAATGSLRSHHTATVFPIGGTSVTRWLGEPHLVVGETRLGAVEARHQRIQLPLLTVRRLRDVGAPRTAVLTARPGRASRSARPRRSGRP